jgi:hypothetical protein
LTDPPFDYHDYHRTIVAFHGTRAEIAADLVDGQPFRVSSNTDDWLGSGAYFWEYAPKQAWWWARDFKRYPRPAVVGAMIRLGNCFDLLDPTNVRLLKGAHDVMLKQWAASGFKIPRNGNQHKNLDCAVFNGLYIDAEAGPKPIDSVRAVYVPSMSPPSRRSESGKGAGSMKKRTSRSTSATRRTSSRSGTSGRTADTAGAKAAEEAGYADSPYAYIVEDIRKMTPQEFRELLIRAGIIDENGELTPTYRR